MLVARCSGCAGEQMSVCFLGVMLRGGWTFGDTRWFSHDGWRWVSVDLFCKACLLCVEICMSFVV